jgi:hypothetical protein
MLTNLEGEQWTRRTKRARGMPRLHQKVIRRVKILGTGGRMTYFKSSLVMR